MQRTPQNQQRRADGSRGSFKHWTLGGTALAMALLAMTGTASAQARGSSSSDGAAEVGEVVVTGTSIRGIKPVGSATVPLSKEDILNTGLANTADVVRTLPQLQNIGIDETRTGGSQDAGTNNGRGTALNLRGLGSNATLMLIDGRRLAPSGTLSAFGDPNQIPVAALERIEVVTDGASAIYGTDAVGGVVNFILKKNYDGFEVTGRYTTTGGYDQKGISAVFGKVWDRGNVILAYDHDDRSRMLRGKVPYLRQDLRPFGGNDGRINGATITPGASPLIVVQTGSTFNYFALPPGSSGVGVTASQLLPGIPTVIDSADYVDYLPARTRTSLTGFANYEVTDKVAVYWEGFLNIRDSRSRGYRADTILLPANNRFYIPGIPGVAPGASLSVRYALAKDIGERITLATERSSSNTVGMKVALPADWSADAYFTHGLAKNCQCEEGEKSGILNTTALRNLLVANDPLFNPFSPTAIDATTRSRILGENLLRNQTILKDGVIKFDGPLFAIPGGQVRAAIGGEYLNIVGNYRNAGTTTRPDNIFVGTYSGSKSRTVKAAFAELFVPVVGEDNAMPLVKRLDLSMATRYEKYSDFGSTNNPKLGVTWDPTDDLSIRGTVGRSFRAPSLQENNEDVVTTFILTTTNNNARDPAIPITNAGTGQSNILQRTGGNAGLTPEKAKTYSVGFDYTPHWIEGLRLSATYYNIKYTDKIVGLNDQVGNFLASPANRAAYAPYIVAAAQPSTCVEGVVSTYNPVYQPLFNRPYPMPFTNTPACSIVAYLNAQSQNLGSVNQDGIDMQASYRFETPIGDLSIGGSLTKILNLKQTLSPVSGMVDVLDTINNPVSKRGRLNFGWSRGIVNTNLFLNYTGSYLNNTPITVSGVRQSEKKVPSWTTADANVSFRSPQDAEGWMQGLRLSLSVQNFTDKKPPVVLVGATAFDNQQSNPYGRIFSVELSKAF